jgi:serine 3-dehydrogenase (NADP+)
MARLNDQVAIIAGASSGMGRATALAFAEEGVRLVIAARRRAELDELAAEIAGRGGEVIAKVADVGVADDVEAVVQQAITTFGRVDVMVNTAGVNTPDRKVGVVTPEAWHGILATNLDGAFYWTRAVLPQMRAQKNGLIIHISSISGKWADMSGAAYQASKHGLVGLAYATMIEERENGIRVSVIFPGLCDTPLLSNRPSPPTQEARDKMMKPEDIADACVFIASLPPRTYVPELVMLPLALQCVGAAI